MAELIKLECKGIKCDAPNCEYEDLTVEFGKQWVDVPCPKCGANLCTKKDYNTIMKMMKVVKAFNTIGRVIGFKPDPNDKLKVFNIDMNGTGKIKISDADEKK